jgi:hypothetical protein
MSLPEIKKDIKYITTKVPSGKSIGVRGWKVKDEKELLFALEVEEDFDNNKINHIITMIRGCTDDVGKFDTLSESDVLKAAVEVRKLAKGDTIEYNYECPHCANKFFDEVNLTKGLTTKDFDPKPLNINDQLIVTFKDLDWKSVAKIYEEVDSSAKFAFKQIMHSIDSMTIEGNTYTEFTPAEVEARIDELSSDELKIIYKGFEERQSSCVLSRSIKCIKCKKDIDVNFGEMLSFLVL